MSYVCLFWCILTIIVRVQQIIEMKSSIVLNTLSLEHLVSLGENIISIWSSLSKIHAIIKSLWSVARVPVPEPNTEPGSQSLRLKTIRCIQLIWYTVTITVRVQQIVEMMSSINLNELSLNYLFSLGKKFGSTVSSFSRIHAIIRSLWSVTLFPVPRPSTEPGFQELILKMSRYILLIGYIVTIIVQLHQIVEIGLNEFSLNQLFSLGERIISISSLFSNIDVVINSLWP